jgi:glycogen debranching enzyme
MACEVSSGAIRITWVYQDSCAAQSFLEPLSLHLSDACLGSISEIFDGDEPHGPNGCFAQAWSVAEVLRSWLHLQNATKLKGST